MSRLEAEFTGCMTDSVASRVKLENLLRSMNPGNSQVMMDAYDQAWWGFGEECCLRNPVGATKFILRMLEYVMASPRPDEMQINPHMELCRLAIYFQFLRNVLPVPSESIGMIREWVYGKLKLCRKEMEEMIVSGFLKHALVDANARSYFKKWLNDSVTAHAYKDGVRCAEQLRLSRRS
jgi:hypothetical protein